MEEPKDKADLKKTTEQFMKLLQEIAPVLFTIEVLNSKLLKDVEYGEIHIIEKVKKGKIVLIEASPTIQKLIES